MDELIGRIVAAIGIDQTTARKAVGVVLAFLAHEGPSGKVEAFLGKLPGAKELLQAAGGRQAGSGGMMGAGMTLMAAGLGMGQIQDVVREIVAHARAQGAHAELSAIASEIPALKSYV